MNGRLVEWILCYSDGKTAIYLVQMDCVRWEVTEVAAAVVGETRVRAAVAVAVAVAFAGLVSC